MANSFKTILPEEVATTRTLLHEAIPITGTIVSGTYSDENIKYFSHGMYEAVFDYPFLSSSANHIFDLTAGYASGSVFQNSSNVQDQKKINIYNQMAQVLAGYDISGAIKQFAPSGSSDSSGNKMDSCLFMNFARLLNKDEVKKDSFRFSFYSNCPAGAAGLNPNTRTGKISIGDFGANTSFKTDSPAGEYGLLFVKNAATATINGVAAGVLSGGASFTLKNSAGVVTTYVINGGGAFGTQPGGAAGTSINLFVGGASSRADVVEAIRKVINATTNADYTATDDGSDVTVTQSTVGTAGNQTNTDSGTGLTVGNFSGGTDGTGAGAEIAGHIYYQAGIAVLTSSIVTANANTMTTASAPSTGIVTSSIEDLFVSGTIDELANHIRYAYDDVDYNNTTELNSTIYFCRANNTEFNYSSNPTYISASEIVVKNNNPKADPVSYITSVGLYSPDNELLAVAKLSEPLKKSPSNEITLRVRLDY